MCRTCVNGGTGWASAGSVTNNSQTYTAYNHASSAAQLPVVDLVGVTLNGAGLGAL